MTVDATYSCDKHVVKYVADLGTCRLAICEGVYVPAEDTWLTLEGCEALLRSRKGLDSIVEVGAGTGVITLSLVSSEALRLRYVILIDVDPCATRCSLYNARLNNVDHLVDVAQCDNVGCLRPLDKVLVAYNTPYLPCSTEEDGRAWSPWCGGLLESKRLVKFVSTWRCKDCCVVFTLSSLSGNIGEVLSDAAEGGLSVVNVLKEHYFFEDIVVVVACRGTAGKKV